MVTRFGMGERLGPVSYESEPQGFLGQAMEGPRRYAEDTAREIDMAVRDLVDAAFMRARRLLEHNRDLLDAGARQLLEHETLADAELAAVLGKVRLEERQAA
jgi:cell division protease FtsH